MLLIEEGLDRLDRGGRARPSEVDAVGQVGDADGDRHRDVLAERPVAGVCTGGSLVHVKQRTRFT